MKQLIWPILGLLCILGYYAFVVGNSQNIPFADDLAIMANMYDIRHTHTLSGQLWGLLAYHNEHRLLLPRLATLALAKLNGGVIDFRWWVWFGNGLLLGLLFILYRVFITYKKPFLYFMPIILLLFQPLWTELTYWGMAAIQNMGVLTLGATTLYLVTRDRSSFLTLVAVFMLTALTMLTGANGILLFVSVGFVLLLKRQFKQLIGWLLASSLSIKLYWIGFVPEIHSANEALVSSSLLNKGLSFAGLAGAFIDSQRYEWLSIGIGTIFLSLFTYLGYQRLQALLRSSTQLLKYPDLFVLAYSSFLLLTMGAISTHRSYDSVLHVGRYKIYGVLLLVCFYLLSLSYFHWPRWTIAGLMVLSLVFNGVAYQRSLIAMSLHRAYLSTQLRNWVLYKEVEAPSAFMRAYYEQRWTRTYEEGFYRPPVAR